MIEAVLGTYRDTRNPGETFIDTLRRVGHDPVQGRRQRRALQGRGRRMNRRLKLLSAEDHVDDGDPKVLQLPNDADPLAIEVNLGDIERIDLNFPKFTDGRAYSQAFLLRRRLGFQGDIRATGDVLIDQLVQMERTGSRARCSRKASTPPTRSASSTASPGFYQGDAWHAAPHFGAAG